MSENHFDDRWVKREILKTHCEVFKWHREDCLRCGLIRWIFGHGNKTEWYCSKGHKLWTNIANFIKAMGA